MNKGAVLSLLFVGLITGSYLEFETNLNRDVDLRDSGDTPVCPAGAFAFGSSGRNILDGPGLFSLNAALSKNFQLKEGVRLQVRLETFNFPNRTNFVPTNAFRQFNGLGGGFFSRVGNIGRGGGPRVFQYALKLRF